MMIGSVVSIDVTPPAAIGASGPPILTRSGASRSVAISLMMLDNNATVPKFGATVTGYEYAGERIVAESGANGQTVCGRPSGQNQCGRKRPGECAEHSSGWKQSHSHIKGLESGDNVPVTSHTYPPDEKSRAHKA